MNPKDILEKSFQDAVKLIESGKAQKNLGKIKADVDYLIEKIDSNKSIVSALVTSLVKKISRPAQDVRLHRTDGFK